MDTYLLFKVCQPTVEIKEAPHQANSGTEGNNSRCVFSHGSSFLILWPPRPPAPERFAHLSRPLSVGGFRVCLSLRSRGLCLFFLPVRRVGEHRKKKMVGGVARRGAARSLVYTVASYSALSGTTRSSVTRHAGRTTTGRRADGKRRVSFVEPTTRPRTVMRIAGGRMRSNIA